MLCCQGHTKQMRNKHGDGWEQGLWQPGQQHPPLTLRAVGWLIVPCWPPVLRSVLLVTAVLTTPNTQCKHEYRKIMTRMVRMSQQVVCLKSLEKLVNNLVFTQGLCICMITFSQALSVLCWVVFRLWETIFFHMSKMCRLSFSCIFFHKQFTLDFHPSCSIQCVNGMFYSDCILITITVC